MIEHPSHAHIARKYLDPHLDKELSDLFDKYISDRSVEEELEVTLIQISGRYPKFVYEPLRDLYLQIKEDFYGKAVEE